MIEQQLKVILDSYFKKTLLNAVMVLALIGSIGSCLLLAAITLALQKPEYAWWLVGGVSVFWLIALLIMWAISAHKSRKIKRAASNLHIHWIGIALELGLNYLTSRKS